MISREEITKISLEMGLEASEIEKDYVLSWILAAISQNEELSDKWLFKGGTCLRKCFFENYRYSEDLDFTIANKVAFDLEMLESSVSHIAAWVYKNTGIEIDTTRSIFESVKNPANQLILQGRIFYHGPASPTWLNHYQFMQS
jgi:predicted nucleotidyltransferase component of viral defense system